MATYGPDGNLQEEISYGTQGFTSLSAVSAVGPGVVLNGGACRSSHTIVVASSPGVSAGAVQLQGSLDGINWFNLGAAINTNTASTTFAPVVVSNQPVQYLRAYITSVITGGTVTALIAST